MPFVPIVGADNVGFVDQLQDTINYPGLIGAAVTNPGIGRWCRRHARPPDPRTARSPLPNTVVPDPAGLGQRQRCRQGSAGGRSDPSLKLDPIWPVELRSRTGPPTPSSAAAGLQGPGRVDPSPVGMTQGVSAWPAPPDYRHGRSPPPTCCSRRPASPSATARSPRCAVPRWRCARVRSTRCSAPTAPARARSSRSSPAPCGADAGSHLHPWQRSAPSARHADARRAGIVSVYQDPSLIPDLDIADNLRLTMHPVDGLRGWLQQLGIPGSRLDEYAARSAAADAAHHRPRARAGARSRTSC